MGGREIEVVRGHRIDYQLYKYLLQYFSEGGLESLFNAVRRPSGRYYVRANTLRINPGDLINRLRERNIDVYPDEHLNEALWIPVKGPNRIPSTRKIVIADKRAAESVYMGANLYVPRCCEV
jgi:hypothetical protein